MTALPVRLALAGLYLVAVNLGSGLLAVELRYPSLWGAQEVFHEYAYPALYNWALMHLLSMLPLALVVFRYSTFSKQQIRRCQYLLLAALVVLFFIEVKLPYGRLRHIPFALFLGVDVIVALLISLLFYPPWKVIVAILTLSTIAWVSLIVRTGDFSANANNIMTDRKSVTEPEPKGFFDHGAQVKKSDHTLYIVVVNEVVGPDMGPSGEKICREAKALVSPGSNDVVAIQVNTWFQPEKKYVYNAGRGSYNNTTEWQCDYKLPEPPTQ